MQTALIGFTGFVGSNLVTQQSFDDYYNSKNIEEIREKHYDLIVCAGSRGERWKANLYPKKDWEEIQKLMNSLKYIKTDRFILVSTLDVYPNTDGVYEDYPIHIDNFTQPYGYHRYLLEKFIKNQFPRVTFIRLPQIYGINIKKNFVYDLIYDNALDFTHKNTMHQWYNLKNLWKDIQVVIQHNIPVVNFAVEPISARELTKYSRNMEFTTVTKGPPLIFNILTRYGKLFGSKDSYIYHKKKTLLDLKEFITRERKKIIDKRKKPI